MNLLDRMHWFDTRRKELEIQSAREGGRIVNHEGWRLAYYRYPYLIRVGQKTLWRRFCDVFGNMMEINEKGKLSPIPAMANDLELTKKFTHLLEEWGGRGAGLPTDMIGEARKILLSYFSDGEPLGVRLFDEITAPKNPVLVKYSKRPYLEQMLSEGIVRLSPASYYAKASHIAAVKDLETRRDFIIPTFREYLSGQTSYEMDGQLLDISKGDIRITKSTPDYYLFCTCREIDRRLPTDFEADSALIILDREKFISKLKKAFLSHMPNWKAIDGNVSYYDPYLHFEVFPYLQMIKHFAFMYQKEHRIVFFSPDKVEEDLQPIMLNVGSMTEYAKLVILKN